jgi:hypothetical protein
MKENEESDGILKNISFEDGWYVDRKHFCAYVRTLPSYSPFRSTRKNPTLLFSMTYLCMFYVHDNVHLMLCNG